MQQNEKEIKNSEEAKSFRFTYSAKEQEEIKKIRQKYQPEQENKMEQLRRLDARVTQKATMSSIILGVAGALVFGLGMSLAMTDIASLVGMQESMGMATGIFIGLTGILLMGFAYPVYNKILKKEREKIAPEILKLTEELMR